MDRILTDKELEKLNSTDGIIEMLCGIPNFKSEMYNQLDKEKKDLIDYTMSIDLISNKQIERNLRRSLDSENLALLEKRKLIALSLLYFGKKDDTGKYLTYTCPYTGKEYNISEIERELEKKQSEKDDNKRLELEHIMPHSGGGGTVLFNCLLSSVEANGKGEKGNRHLIDWFSQSDYYDLNRLNRIVCYMLSAYSIAYKKYKKSALEFNYEFVDGKEGNADNNELETIRKEKTKSKQKNNTQENESQNNKTKIEGYKIYLDQLVNKLKEDNYDITEIDKKIKVLEEDGIFKTNKKYELVQRIVEDIFKEENTDTSYLTNSLKVDYYRLVDSIEVENEKEIENEIKARIEIIKGILEKTNKSMKDYYISMKDIEDIDILYIPTYKISDNDKGIFEESIKLSPETKINILLEMLKNADQDEFQELLNANNKLTFKIYKKDENGKVIKDANEKKEVEKDFNVTIGAFWNNNKDALLEIIYKDEQYEDIKEKLDDYYMDNDTGAKTNEGAKRRREIFLEMLKNADQDEFQELLKDKSTITFKIYKKDKDGKVIKDANEKKEVEKDFNVTIGAFWSNNKDALLDIIYKDEQYEDIKEKLDDYYMDNDTGAKTNEGAKRRREIFLEMLKNADEKEFQELLKDKSTITFKIYKKDKDGKVIKDANEKKEVEKDFNVTIGAFWSNKKDALLEIIYKEEQYKDIREKLDDYYIKTRSGSITNEGAKRRREIFLEMLKNADQAEFQELLSANNKLTFKIYKKDANVKKVIEKDFNVTIGAFWSNNKDALLEIIYKDEQYEDIKEKLDDYYMDNDTGAITNEGIKRRREIFLEMLKNADQAEFQELLSANNKLTFKIYKKDANVKKVIEKDFNVKIGTFWDNNKDDLLDIICKEKKYEDIREKLDDYYMNPRTGARTNEGAKRRKEIFLEMLKNADEKEFQELLSSLNDITFKIYKKDKDGKIELDENGKKVVEKDFNVEIGQFWNSNKDDKLIPLLFYNKYYDAKNNIFVQSGEDYSGKEYDIVRERVLKRLKVNRIEDYMNTEKYINKLKSKSNKAKKLGNMIELVEDLINKKEKLIDYRDELLEANAKLEQEKANSMVVTNYAR